MGQSVAVAHLTKPDISLNQDIARHGYEISIYQDISHLAKPEISIHHDITHMPKPEISIYQDISQYTDMRYRYIRILICLYITRESGAECGCGSYDQA